MAAPPIKWAHIELPKDLGGLGVGNIMYKNLILLFKWWWRFSEIDGSLWKRILLFIYNIKGLKASSDAFRKVKDGIWGQMLENDEETSRVRSIVERGMCLKVGNGQSILFWHDVWCVDRPLKVVFPRLFMLSVQKSCFIHQMGLWQDSVWSWSLTWRRVLYEWEREDVGRLEDLLAQKPPRSDRADGVLWRGSCPDSFPSKQVLKDVYGDHRPILPKQIINFTWHCRIPPRAQLTLWMANLEKLKTGDKLVDKGIIDVQQALCPFCRSVMETNSHLLFTCEFSWRIWMDMLDWWGIQGALHDRCEMFVVQWSGLMKRKKWKNLWNLTLGCVIWSLWYERNKSKFERKIPSVRELSFNLKCRIGSWAQELLGYREFCLHDLIHYLGAVIS